MAAEIEVHPLLQPGVHPAIYEKLQYPPTTTLEKLLIAGEST